VSAKILVIAKSSGRQYRTDRTKAELKVRRGSFFWRDNFTIEEIEPRFRAPLWDGFLGTGNAIPFARIQNKLCSPPKLHYAIPSAGAHSRVVSCLDTNRELVSSSLISAVRFVQERTEDESQSGRAAIDVGGEAAQLPLDKVLQ